MERTLWSYVQCFYRASSYRENLCAPAAEKLLEQYLLAPSDTMTYDCRKLFSRETRKPPHSTLHIAHRTSQPTLNSPASSSFIQKLPHTHTLLTVLLIAAMGRITLFVTESCPHCARAIKALEERDIPFEKISLVKNPGKCGSKYLIGCCLGVALALKLYFMFCRSPPKGYAVSFGPDDGASNLFQ